MSEHIHKQLEVYDVLVDQTTNFAIMEARTYNSDTRLYDRGYAIVHKADGIVQGYGNSLPSILQAIVSCETTVQQFKAYKEAQAQSHVSEAKVSLMDFGEQADDVTKH